MEGRGSSKENGKPGESVRASLEGPTTLPDAWRRGDGVGQCSRVGGLGEAEGRDLRVFWGTAGLRGSEPSRTASSGGSERVLRKRDVDDVGRVARGGSRTVFLPLFVLFLVTW